MDITLSPDGMASDLLLRNIDPNVRAWIERESDERRVSQNRLVQEVLALASAARAGLPLDAPAVWGEAEDAPSVGLPFRFIDLFAGIGGIRIGLERVGGECVFSSEWDVQAQRTYREWFGETPAGDVNEPGLIEGIPPHDVLAAGFPCQPFSIAGVSKKNSLGRKHGFADARQGNLFFSIMRCVDLHRPAVLLLENVKNLRSHDKGRTWMRISDEIRRRGYTITAAIVDACHWVPQHRERIFIVALDKQVFGSDVAFRFSSPPTDRGLKFRSILDAAVPERYTLSDNLWRYLQDYAKGHKAKGNGFGYGIAPMDGVSRTLSARYYKDGSEVLIAQPGKNPRRLTPREAARLMGFPDDLPIVVSDTQAYRQFGNAVVPAVVEWIGRDLVKLIASELRSRSRGVLLPPRRIRTRIV